MINYNISINPYKYNAINFDFRSRALCPKLFIFVKLVETVDSFVVLVDTGFKLNIMKIICP